MEKEGQGEKDSPALAAPEHDPVDQRPPCAEDGVGGKAEEPPFQPVFPWGSPHPDYARIGEVVGHLSRVAKEGMTLVVFPEGMSINFLSGLGNPIYYNLYLPIDLARPRVVASLVADLEATPPDFIVETARPLEEYGAARFRDYAAPVVDFVRRNYQVEREFNGEAVLYRRRAGGSTPGLAEGAVSPGETGEKKGPPPAAENP